MAESACESYILFCAFNRQKGMCTQSSHICFKTRGVITFLPPFPALGEELAKVQKELSGSKEKAAILIEMCKQNESRIEELVMENAKLKSQLSTVDRTSQSYDVRKDICTHIQMGTCTHADPSVSVAIIYHLV